MATVQPQLQDPRVYDYLNDKIQTSADLKSLDSLLDALRNQHSLLRQQLDKVTDNLGAAETEQKQHASTVLTKSHDYLHRQTDIDNRLTEIRTSPTISAVVASHRRNLTRLQQLEVAKGYITILQAVNILTEQTAAVIATDPKAALVPYHTLQQIAGQLRVRHGVAEGAAVHLVEYVEQATARLWDDMKERLGRQFQETLDAVRWPTQELDVDKMRKFEGAFTKILALRKTEQEMAEDLDISTLDSLGKISQAPRYAPLLAFTALSKAFALRLTRRANQHLTAGMGILDANGLADHDAVQEFITALLPIVRRKIDSDLPALASQGPLASHFVQQALKFDATLREEYLYSPFGIDPDDWRGVTHEVLTVNDSDFFKKWLAVEKDFALDRYENIIAAEDAWVIDYDSVEPSETKPTKSAFRVKELLELVTERYRPLQSFSQKLRFLMDIQITILEKYHDRLRSSIEAFKMLSSSIGRAVQGRGKQDGESIAGLTGLERLCRVYGSAVFLGSCMKDWGEDLFFLEMWEELGSRARKNTVGGLLSSIANLGAAAQESNEEEGALFDEIAESYSRVLQETASMIHDLVSNATREDLKPYYRIPQWQVVEEAAEPKEAAHSTELVPLLKTLSSFCAYLSRFWSPNVFQREFRRVLVSLENYLMDSIVSRNQFSEQGGQQFLCDMQAVWATVQPWVPDAPGVMRRVHETCILLALPAEPKDPDAADDARRTLKHVVDHMFEDNQKGRAVMEELGIYTLTIAEARNTLQRRVDNKLYGPEDAGTADGAEAHPRERERNDAEDEPGDGEEKDIESAIAAEIEDINAKKAKKGKRITSIRLDTQCLIFFHTRAPIDPVELVAAIFRDLEENRKRQTRFTNRLTPISRTCRANYEDLEAIAKEVLQPHFHSGRTGVKFAIRPNLRDHNVMNRDEIIKTVARTVGAEHKVDLKNYELLVVVEVFRLRLGCLFLLLLLSIKEPTDANGERGTFPSRVVRDFEHYKRFNLAKVLDESEARTDEKACGVAPE
ncbi:hypothetical protein Dda_1261 [Drechslerella dactyloides]|uniref:THUMP domain-containing protein n=1 Tax=Drechslerella dactyloides TaxID=74499 RepID=A0AAD6NLU4_DREDA|nr:hypothetical protein Dda_1261 [Drechslerella dactyloides]